MTGIYLFFVFRLQVYKQRQALKESKAAKKKVVLGQLKEIKMKVMG